MALVAGASRFLSQAILAQKTGSAFDAGNVLGFTSSASILDAGRGNSVRGIGLSARARALTSSQLQSSASTANQLFSLSGGASATVEAATIQIAGLRATTVSSRVIPELRQDNGGVTENADLGSNIDTEA